eukprot:TRINITY_DN3196_c0_g2_i1.p4 TRINITY_DN3196_c0_g2~~TRINITY_DN3196_c0_g2_i1.p4  ORF type:complete len:120 (+),score=6.47 TRINITY_DN3196_c0_g2_i1:182-541(+)
MIDEWSKEVHESRYRTAIRLQKRNHRLRSKGKQIPDGNSSVLPIMLTFGTFFGYYWWKMQGKQVGRGWKSLPIISLFTRSEHSKKQQQQHRYEQIQKQMIPQSSSVKKKGKKKKGKKRR